MNANIVKMEILRFMKDDLKGQIKSPFYLKK